MSAYAVPGLQCRLCQDINFQPWQDLTNNEKATVFLSIDEEIDEDENPFFASTLYYIHHLSLAALQKSADEGCQFCYQMLYGALERALADKEDDLAPVYLTLDGSRSIQHGEAFDEQNYYGELMVHIGSDYRADMRLRAYNDDFENPALLGRHVNNNTTTGSLANLDLAAKWLHNCVNNHAYCSRQMPISPLPLRVLDIGSPENPQGIFLSEGRGRLGSYATLSYCWGTLTQLPLHATTEDNINDHKHSVHPSVLPQTFRDAIFVCRHLGIRFLWVDSMCIIQQNKDDWDEQSKQMAEIYSGAMLNIAAASGEDTDAGLFVDRDPRKTYPCPLSFRWKNESGSIVTSSFLSCLNLESEQYGHLDTRGWTFQEMYLPCRTLRFSNSGMYWTCASLNASEALPTGILPLNTKSDFDKYIRPQPDGSAIIQKDNSQKYTWWYRAIEQYSLRQFTRESDRLRAISGLASRFNSGLGDEYLAGIWKGDIARGLTWKTVRDSDGNIAGPSTIQEASLPLAPSWSWASRPGKLIDYSGRNDPFPSELEDSYSIDALASIGPPKTIFLEILGSDFTPQTAIPSVMTEGSYLRIRGLVLKAILRSSRGLMVKSPFGNYCSGRGLAVFDELVNPGDELYCLPISLGSGHKLPRGETEKRLPVEDNSIASIKDRISFQRQMLELGGFMLPGTTWCGDEVLHAKLDKGSSFKCLVLKKVGIDGIRFRRVGYVVVGDGHCFERVAPVILELI